MASMQAPDARRLHVRTACGPCRESKIKCDGAVPACSNCRSKQRHCRFQAVDDKRRLTLRTAVELLSNRTEQLYRFITDNNLRPPPMDDAEHESLLKVLAYQRISASILPKDLRPPPASRARRTSRVTHMQSQHDRTPEDEQLPLQTSPLSVSADGSHDSTYSWNVSGQDQEVRVAERDGEMQGSAAFEPSDPGLPRDSGFWDLGQIQNDNIEPPSTLLATANMPPFAFTRQDPVPFPSDDDQSGATPSDSENTEALVDQLSERIGTLHVGAGGHIRYYGPTSNFTLVKMPMAETLTLQRTIRTDGEDYLCRLGLQKEVPDALIAHLTNLYFAWQDPALHVVNRTMFETAKARWWGEEETPYYTESLQNAICALGAAFETRHHPALVTFPRSLADFFAERARALLEIELDSPCVATVQAMAVLSSHDIGCKRDTRGWLYSGMAMRLAFDLGLHVDMTFHVTEGTLSQTEADLRAEVFWGTYTIDHSWGFYLGRPFRTHTEDITVAIPGPETCPDFGDQWVPYISPGSPQRVPVPSLQGELQRQRVLMAQIMAPVANALYGNFSIPCKTLQEINADTVDKLLKWKQNLPPTLQIDLEDKKSSPLPHVLLLHMQYHQNIIHAHRPYMSKTYHQPFPPQGPGHNHARMMCVGSAFSIAKLLLIYESNYDLRRINVQAVGIVCSAALLLIFTNVIRYKTQGAGDAEVLVNACFRALDEFSSAWDSSKRARDLLLLLQRQWERSGRSARVRKSASFTTDPDTVSRQRMRTSYSGHLQANQSIGDVTTLNQEYEQILSQQSAAGMAMGLSFDWVTTGFPFTGTEDQFNQL